MANSKARGYTLIEMSVVIVLVALFATLIMPNLVKREENQRDDTFLNRLKSLAANSRETAISQNEILDMKLDGSRMTVVKDALAPDSDPTQGAAPSNDAAEVYGLDVPPSVNPTKFQAGGRDASSSDWVLRFYPDGTADEGGIEFTVGASTYALNVTQHGAATLDDQLTDLTTERWSAGDYEPR